MRALAMFGLCLALAAPMQAQDTSVVINGRSRNSSSVADTTIIIRRSGKPDQVIRVTGSLNKELRMNLERQLDEMRTSMSQMRRSSGELRAQSLELAKRESEMGNQIRARTLDLGQRDSAMAGQMRAQTLDLARREAAVAGQLRLAEIPRAGMMLRLDTLRMTQELSRANEMLARSSRDLAGRSMRVFEARPLLGVTVDLNVRESDRYGAYINAVTPGGPASKAGIRAGDIIMRIGSKSLTAPDSIRRGADQSIPGLRLIEFASRLEVGKAVQVELRRGNDTRKVMVTPVEDDAMAMYVEGVPGVGGGTFTMTPRSGGAGGAPSGWVTTAPRAGMAMPEAPLEARFFENFPRSANGEKMAWVSAFGGPLADLELAPMNEKLGSYFGVAEGVLVIDVPEKASLGLLPGDVVTMVDGRKISSPTQLTRILLTYEKGEEFKITVMRQKRTETLTTKLP